MASTLRISFITGTIVCAALALPAVTQATVYCVPDPSIEPSCQSGQSTIPGAFDAAESNSGPDTVRIGAGTYIAPSPEGFWYMNDTEPVSVIGAGTSQTIINTPDVSMVPMDFTQYLSLNVWGPGSSISDLSVDMPTPAGAANTNQQFLGIVMPHANTSITGVDVDAPSVPVNGTAILVASGTVTGSSITMPLGVFPFSSGIRAVQTTADDLLASGNEITADFGISYSNPGSGSLTVSRTLLRPHVIGLEAAAGDAQIESTVVNLSNREDAVAIVAGFENMLNTRASTVEADGVTVVGTGVGQVGARAFGTDDNTPPMGDAASVSLSNSVISLTGSSNRSLDRQADNGGSVNITTSYSNYDASTAADTGNPNGSSGGIAEFSRTFLAPGFVDPGSGDFHLQPSSALIDIGDPAAPPTDASDLDGDPRVLMGFPSCAPRRDIGADEFRPSPPVSPLNCAVSPPPAATEPKRKCKKKKRKRPAAEVAKKKKKRCKKKKRRQ
jgi:hypothetical protein